MYIPSRYLMHKVFFAMVISTHRLPLGHAKGVFSVKKSTRTFPFFPLNKKKKTNVREKLLGTLVVKTFPPHSVCHHCPLSVCVVPLSACHELFLPSHKSESRRSIVF